MRCTECGAPGYSRKTKTPEWRCRSQNCGHEWDATTTTPEEEIPSIWWGLSPEEQLVVENRQRLREEAYWRRQKGKRSNWSSSGAFFGFFFGVVIGRLLSGTTEGAALGGLTIAFIAYVAGKCWYDWFGWPDSWDD